MRDEGSVAIHISSRLCIQLLWRKGYTSCYHSHFSSNRMNLLANQTQQMRQINLWLSFVLKISLNRVTASAHACLPSLWFVSDFSAIYPLPLSSQAVGTKKHFLWYSSGAERGVQHASLALYRLVGRDTNSTGIDSLCYINRLERIKQLWSHIFPLWTQTCMHVRAHAYTDNWLGLFKLLPLTPPPPVIMGRKGNERRGGGGEDGYWVTEAAVLFMASSMIFPAGGKKTRWCRSFNSFIISFCFSYTQGLSFNSSLNRSLGRGLHSVGCVCTLQI